MLAVVIMAGGKGERFWPWSRAKTPKQLLPLLGTRTMIQETARRVETIVDHDHLFVVTLRDYAELVLEQLPQILPDNVIVEPSGKNTAACIGLAAAHIRHRFRSDDITMVVLPSDHLISDEGLFIATLMSAVEAADGGDRLITIGIRPTHPETGYGYIKYLSEHVVLRSSKAYRVDCFKEKPDVETATRFVQEGTYVWNSGMFVWRVDSIRSAIRDLMPELWAGLEQIEKVMESADGDQVIQSIWAGLPSVSIDYGVMEKASNIYVIPGEFGWSDVGNWAALGSLLPVDEHGNASSSRHVALDTSGCMIHSPKRLVATLGVSDLVIVEMDDVSLICNKDRVQDLRKVLQKLREQGLERYI
jgi:mannose-1-phosphate guanylyltransferase